MIEQQFIETLKEIANNTEPLDLFKQNLGWWSFGTSVIGVLISSLAAFFSFGGYKYQKESAKKLENIVPGDINFNAISFKLVRNIIDFKSIFNGHSSYKDFPVKLVIESNKLPDDLLDLKKYEKDKDCYYSAFNIVLSWRNYNLYLNQLWDKISAEKTSSSFSEFANFLIQYSTVQLKAIKNFEKKKEKGLSISDNDYLIAWNLLDLFFENLQAVRVLVSENYIKSLDTIIYPKTRSYFEYEFIPERIDIREYIQSKNHSHSLKNIGGSAHIHSNLDIPSIIQSIKQGEYDFLSEKLNINYSFSDIDFSNYKETYINVIEPLLVAFRRMEFKQMNRIINQNTWTDD